MNKTLKMEIEIEGDKSIIDSILSSLREHFSNIEQTIGVRLVTVWEFNHSRGVWLTYGWGNGDDKTQIWMPLKQEEEKGERLEARGKRQPLALSPKIKGEKHV